MNYIYSLILLLTFSFCSTVKVIDKNADTVPDFTPIKDDELAKRYAPILESGSEHGDPYGLYYRASKVSLIIDKTGKIQQVEYETAENYDPNKFGVKHKHMERKGFHKEPVLFKVISWNHLFDYIADNSSNVVNTIRLTPVYFNQQLWEEYGMVKEKESFFSRSRAHKPYEKEFVE